MNLLAIDTSSENISLSVSRQDKIAVKFNRRIKFGATKLMPLIEEYAEKEGIDLKEMDAFVIGAGPGSFTGLRVSFSIIKAFHLVYNKPVIKIGSFFSLGYPFIKKYEKIAVISDARRDLIYGAAFKVKKGVLKIDGKEKLFLLKDFVKNKQDYFFVSYDQHLRRQALDLFPRVNFYDKPVWPKAEVLLELGRQEYFKGKFTPLSKLAPLYLHPKTCQIRNIVKR